MQDAETGTWWQQVSGQAILGPLRGKQLTLVPFDQLTYAAWLEESPDGRVLAPDARIAAANRYAAADWEDRMQKTPAPRSADNDRRLPPRALVVGIEVGGAARAYPLAGRQPSGVVLDTLGGAAIAIVRGPDGRSTRAFNRTIDGRALELVAKVGASPFRMADLESASEWDFAGIAVGGPLKGRQLCRVPLLEEYWFDWKTYHPSTDVARHIF
jgi:hypothetical protein